MIETIGINYNMDLTPLYMGISQLPTQQIKIKQN